MSTTTTAASADPTAARYQCGSGCGTLTFTWGRQMPENGRLGTVTLGQFVNKPIQVFDAKSIYNGEGREIAKDWHFQAQDGSFVGHMLVSSPRKSFIRFFKFRASDQWPHVSCSVPVPDPADSREALDRVE